MSLKSLLTMSALIALFASQAFVHADGRVCNPNDPYDFECTYLPAPRCEPTVVGYECYARTVQGGSIHAAVGADIWVARQRAILKCETKTRSRCDTHRLNNDVRSSGGCLQIKR